MRHYLLLILVICVISPALKAQSRDTIHPRIHGKSVRPMKDLDLSPEQKKQLKAINQETKISVDSLKNDTTLDAGMRRELQKQLAEGRRNKVMAVLTPEQQHKFKEASKANAIERRKEKKQLPGNKGRKSGQNAAIASLTNTYWKLLKVKDSALITPENSREVHIKFAASENRLQGYAGCNGLGGDYTLGPDNGIKISVITTKMYCDRMDTENFLTNALTTADKYRIKGERLFLYAGKKLLAEFESVYF